MDPVSHAGFIVAAYAAAFAVVGGLTAWVMVDYRAQLRNLADLERRGAVRRAGPAIRQAREDA
jgi:heme exporter protein D